MLKEAILHMLFIAVVVFAASFLKKDYKDTTTGPDALVQTRGIEKEDEHYPYNTDVIPVTDTLKLK